MPRENRKRGKKHKKVAQEEEKEPTANATDPHAADLHAEAEGSRPSWIVPAVALGDVNLEAPFGYVDADVKAYFRNVDEQMRSWQENVETVPLDQDSDPNEDRRMFFVAALSEMKDKEKMLATDPDCSIILERMLYSMDDFARRVFMDKLSGSYDVLFKHRFASHVCQTLFNVVTDTVSRETQGILPKLTEDADEGDLRTVSQQVLDICEEIQLSFTSLIMDPFASHVLRALLLLLSPNNSNTQQHSNLRSKKSAVWKAKQGPLKSMFTQKGVSGPSTMRAPPSFETASHQFVRVVRESLGENEVRALAANKVASPVLQILLEIEADLEICCEAGSLMDQVLVGVISACQNGYPKQYETSDYLNTLLRDPTSSHLLETLVSRSPDIAFDVVWDNYLKGKLARLAAHPVANFVVARALERLDSQQLEGVCSELSGVWTKVIRASRSGVLRSLIQRASSLHTSCSEVGEAVFSAFELATEDCRELLVPCAVCLLPVSDYEKAQKHERLIQHPQTSGKQVNELLVPKVQGALLIQALLHLPDPHNRIVLDSIFTMSVEDCISLSHHPAGSRIFDALLESPTVPFKDKRRFVVSFIGHYQQLVNDRIGSRVGDRCWDFADTYLKEKIARSLIPFESSLSASYYGKFFARNLNLYLLQRKPEEWKTFQSQRRNGAQTQAQLPASKRPPMDRTIAQRSHPESSSRQESNALPKGRNGKRPRHADEIDELFDDAQLSKRIKSSALKSSDESQPLSKKQTDDPTLSGVLDAIDSAGTARKRRGKVH